MKIKTFIFGAYDKLSGRFLDIVQEDSSAKGVRSLLLSMKVPLKDTLFYCLVEVSSEYPDDCQEIPFDCHKITWYDFPKFFSWEQAYNLAHNFEEAISPLGAQAIINEVRSRPKNADVSKVDPNLFVAKRGM